MQPLLCWCGADAPVDVEHDWEKAAVALVATLKMVGVLSLRCFVEEAGHVVARAAGNFGPSWSTRPI